MENVTIEKDIYDFLYYSYFGAENDKFISAINRAYRDFNRTLSGLAKLLNKDELKEKASNLIKSEINYVIHEKNFTQNSFDSWHKKACYELINLYAEYNFTFTVGHAQKWFNMTFKYLYIMNYELPESIISFLHIPVDKYVMDAVSEWEGYTGFSSAWSKISNYDEYLQFQKWFASFLTVPPFKREFSLWVDAGMLINQ